MNGKSGRVARGQQIKVEQTKEKKTPMTSRHKTPFPFHILYSQ